MKIVVDISILVYCYTPNVIDAGEVFMICQCNKEQKPNFLHFYEALLLMRVIQLFSR